MATRRSVLLGGIGLGLSSHRARAAAVLGDDGIYHQPWFLESFLELADDAEAAAAKGKRFAIMWELRGCPYCRDTHLINFAKPEIESFVKERFDILQLNLLGSREVLDFDGEKLAEKKLAQKYGVRFTPTFQFFDENPRELGGRAPQARESARSVGYLVPKDFLALFRYVAERAYRKGTLQEYIRSGAS
jgi:thioredoxin-related protein